MVIVRLYIIERFLRKVSRREEELSEINFLMSQFFIQLSTSALFPIIIAAAKLNLSINCNLRLIPSTLRSALEVNHYW